MSERTFDVPVFVKDGLHIIQEIACLEDALEFLYQWPENRRGVIYDTALRACHKVFESDFPLSAARNGFAGFAKSAGILEDVSTVLPKMTTSKTGCGGMPT